MDTQPTAGADEIFERSLQDKVAQARRQRDALAAGIEEMRTARSLTTADDEHDPEGSTVSLDQARDAALLNRADDSLAELVAAQQRLLAGTYGVCQSCRQQIPFERLEARPEARLCVPCASGGA